jgi:hypothetical protein
VGCRWLGSRAVALLRKVRALKVVTTCREGGRVCGEVARWGGGRVGGMLKA